MTIVGFDAGSKASGIVVVNGRTFEVIDSFKIENNLGMITLALEKYYSSREDEHGHIVIETMMSYGKRVGREVFDTLEFTGQFSERMKSRFPRWEQKRIPRKEVLRHIDDLYGHMSNDARVRKLLIERFGEEFLQKLRGDCWQAYALAVTFIDEHKKQEQTTATKKTKGGCQWTR